jgi:hypothetical protein
VARQKRLISQLSYRPASLCSLATQFQTWFLELTPCPIAGLKFSTQCSSVCTTEAKDRRELTQEGVLPCLASGEAVICTMMGGPYRLSWRTVPLALAWLPASGNPRCCCCCWCIKKCTQNTDITEIMQGRQGPALHVYSSEILEQSMGG